MGRLLTCRPVTVVSDTAKFLALYSHPHTRYMTAGMGEQRYRLSLEERVTRMMDSELPPFQERTSGARHVLTLTPPRSRHSVWLFWHEDWEVQTWFVNFQRPIHRTGQAVLVEDQVLDIRREPDGSWQWKDDDEFELMIRKGFFGEQEVRLIRKEAHRMADVVANNGSPFCDGWEGWRPDPHWMQPTLPDGWDRIEEVQ